MATLFKVNVSAVIFNSKGQVLLQKRSIDEEVFPGLWGIPGGKVEAGDLSLEDALKREVKEEVGVKIDHPVLVKENIKAGEAHGIAYLVFKTNCTSGKASALEDTDEIRWEELANIDNYNLTPMTKDIIKLASAKI